MDPMWVVKRIFGSRWPGFGCDLSSCLKKRWKRTGTRVAPASGPWIYVAENASKSSAKMPALRTYDFCPAAVAWNVIFIVFDSLGPTTTGCWLVP